MGALSVARSLFDFGARNSASLFSGMGFGVVGNRQPDLGPLFTQWGFDRTLGGGAHALDPLDGTGWQRNLSKVGASGLPVIEAVYGLYANAFAQLRPHQRRTDFATGAITEVNNSPAARLLVQPNSYQSGASLFAGIACDWLSGEALVMALVNDRNEPSSLHLVPRGTWTPRIDPVTREVYYFASNDPDLLFSPQASIADVNSGQMFVLSQKNVMHLRWRTPRHPLVGESPFASAGLAAGVNVALSRTQLLFVENMRRISTVLSTDQMLNRQQMVELREAFDAQAARWATGGMPILSGGLKMSSATLAAIDESVIASLRFANEEIARCAGVPPPMYGDLSAGAIVNSETLVRHWIAVSLGGLIERFERELERLFRLDGRHEVIEMSTEALLRSDLAAQAEALTKLVQGGCLMPDEARRRLGEGPAEGGNQLLVQRQMVPITLSTELAQAELDRLNEPPPPPPPPPGPVPAALAGEDEEDPDAETVEAEPAAAARSLTAEQVEAVALHEMLAAVRRAREARP